MRSYRKKVLSLFEQRLAQKFAQEIEAGKAKLPRPKLLENLSETDSEAKAAEAIANSLEVQAQPFNPDIFSRAQEWVKEAKRFKTNGHERVQVGMVACVDDGERFYLLIAPGDCNPLACTELGRVGGIPARVVSDSCPLALALEGAPVTDYWSHEIKTEEGNRTRRVSKFRFEGKVLAIC